jgi:hypothetical protein
MKKLILLTFLLTACSTASAPADFAEVPCEIFPDFPEQVGELSYAPGLTDVDGYEMQKTSPGGQKMIGTSYTCKAMYTLGEEKVRAVDVLVDQVSEARYERAKDIYAAEHAYVQEISESELEDMSGDYNGVSYQLLKEINDDPAKLSDVFYSGSIFFEDEGLFVTVHGFNTMRTSQEGLPEVQTLIEALIDSHGK